MKKIFLLVAGVILLLASGAEATDVGYKTFRCNHKIIKIGDTQATVLSKCGEPSITTDVGQVSRGTVSGTVRYGRKKAKYKGRSASTTVNVEQWTYFFGRNKFTWILTFRAGRLKRIEIGERPR